MSVLLGLAKVLAFLHSKLWANKKSSGRFPMEGKALGYKALPRVSS